MKLYLIKHLEAGGGNIKEGLSFVLADTEELARDKMEEYIFEHYPEVSPDNEQIVKSIKLVKERVII